MALYNLTNVTSANSIGGSIFAINTLSNNLYALFLILISYIIMFMVFKRYDTKAVFLTVSAIETIFALTVYFTEMISEPAILTPILLFLISIFVYKFSG